MEYASGNIFIREMRFKKKGDVVMGHDHNFDHTSYVAKGGALIEKLAPNGSVVQAVTKIASDGHNWVLIKMKVIHRLTALEDDTVIHCIYSHRTPQGEVVQEPTDFADAYL